MDILEEARDLPFEKEADWIERVKKEGSNIDDHFEWNEKYLDPLRKLTSRAEEKFAENVPEHREHFSPDDPDRSDRTIGGNMGVEVVGRGDWKRLRKEVPDKRLSDFVLFEAVCVHLIFYQRYLGATDMSFEEFAEQSAGKGNSDPCLSKVAKTYLWLEGKDIPEELELQQERLAAF